jgi:hypothetical protein
MLWTNAWTEGDVYELIHLVFEAGIGVYITTRPHIVPHLTEEFEVAAVERLRADPEDIRRFKSAKLQRTIPTIPGGIVTWWSLPGLFELSDFLGTIRKTGRLAWHLIQII